MKEKIPFDKLKMHPPYRVYRRGKNGVVGLDTESLMTGYAFLITDSIGNFKWLRNGDDVISFLCSVAYAKSFNTFWNMDFDATVLLKWFGYDFCKELIGKKHATYKGTRFEYIPKRLLRVGRNTFYDASQYYVPRSLDGALKVYLGRAKSSPGMKKEFTKQHYGNEKVLAYCFQDSKDCRDLTQLLLTDLHDMGFSPSTLASPGTIMEEALVGAVHIPDITKIPQGALEYAYNAYRGGWMECFKRGYFPKLYDYDISSAYPYQVGELIDLEGGKWWYSKGFPTERAVYGWVNCTVDIRSHISPIIYAADVNYTPTGRWNTSLFLDTVNFVPRVGSVEVIDGWYFIPRQGATKPFHYEMRHLFRQKARVRNKWLPKALGVSLYGKLAQKDEDGMTGNLFNPFYADIVTSRTRLQVANYALMLPECLCLVCTDGLTSSAPLPFSVLSQKFGGLRLSHCDKGVIVGTNVFTMRGKRPSGTWRPGRFDWLKLLQDNPNELIYPLEHFRYTTLPEGVVAPAEFEKVGVFKVFPYDFDINYDHKRLFKKVSCGRELMENAYDSMPWEVSIPMRRRELLWELK